MKNAEAVINLSDIAATSLVTLYCRAVESQSSNPILKDQKAVEITQRLNPILAASPDRLLRSLANGKINKNLSVHIALRAQKYDEYTLEFLHRNPGAVIVNIGCGMDTRYYRIKNPTAIFYDLDMPEVIQIKRSFIEESLSYKMVASSVLDYGWMDQISQAGRSSVLFLCEGVFMYLDVEDVRGLVIELQNRFPGSEMICEVVNSRWLSKFWKPLIHRKMQSGAGLGKSAVFRSGISQSREMETWNRGIRFLDEWSYFDSNHPKLGRLRFLRKFELFRKTQWTLHYCLD